MAITEIYPRSRGGGPSHISCSVLSPQKNMWNHFRPTADLINRSGIKVGDKIRIYKDDDTGDLVFEKSPAGKWTVRRYQYGNNFEIAWPDDLLSVPLPRGEGVPLLQASASKGKMIVPGLWS